MDSTKHSNKLANQCFEKNFHFSFMFIFSSFFRPLCNAAKSLYEGLQSWRPFQKSCKSTAHNSNKKAQSQQALVTFCIGPCKEARNKILNQGLLSVVIYYDSLAEAHSDHSQTPKKEVFAKIESHWLFSQEVPSWMFDWVLNAFLVLDQINYYYFSLNTSNIAIL